VSGEPSTRVSGQPNFPRTIPRDRGRCIRFQSHQKIPSRLARRALLGSRLRDGRCVKREIAWLIGRGTGRLGGASGLCLIERILRDN